MEVFHVKFDHVILVHQRYMLFRFQVAEAEPGKAHLDYYIPFFEEDGRPGPIDALRRETLELGEPFCIDVDASEDKGIQGGTVEITVAATDGDDVTVYVKVPDGWGVVKKDDVEVDEEDEA